MGGLMERAATRAKLVRLSLLGCAITGGCASTTVDVKADGRALAPTVAMIVAMPTSLEWDSMADQRRLQRRTGDALLELTGGRAVVAEELRGQDDDYLTKALQAIGEDPARAVTFSLRVGAGRRVVNNASPISTFRPTRRMVVDFSAHIEVRRVGAGDVIGTVDVVAAGNANEPEIGPDGERQGPLEAIDLALEKAVRAFAPALFTIPRGTLIVEVPVAAAGELTARLQAVQELYPELSEAELEQLGSSRERFLVVRPGGLAGLGIAKGDLLGVPGEETLASRAALARAVARGQWPLLTVNRGGQRYLTASR
jgi:hypothetical protein